MRMSEHKYLNWNGQEFVLTTEQYDFIQRNDLWDGLSEFCHQWNIDEDPGAWDLMMECFIPFMTTNDTI